MSFNGKSIFLPDIKGYHDIQKLLSHPMQEFHCTDLMGATIGEISNTESIDARAKLQYLKT